MSNVNKRLHADVSPKYTTRGIKIHFIRIERAIYMTTYYTYESHRQISECACNIREQKPNRTKCVRDEMKCRVEDDKMNIKEKL